jgi:hypothetical protein
MMIKITQESLSTDPSRFNDALSSAHEYFYVETLHCESGGFRGGECQNCILLECDSV